MESGVHLTNTRTATRIHVRQSDLNNMDSSAIGRLLRECGQSKSLSEGRLIHKKLADSGADKDSTFLGNNLIQMYGDCGCLEEAEEVFRKLVQTNVYSWTILAAAYAQNGHDKEALQLLRLMDLSGTKPNSITFINVLTACANLTDLQTGEQVHARIIFEGLDTDVVLGTALLTLYSKCARLEEARCMFDKLTERDSVAWTSIIMAYSQLGQPRVALHLFKKMDLEGVKPCQATFVNALAACTYMEAGEEGDEIYKRAVSCGYQCDVFVGSTAVTMYSRLGRLGDAKAAFDRLRDRHPNSWNAMARAYVRQGCVSEAVELYKDMDGSHVDSFTHVWLLGACVSVEEGKEIHTRVGQGEDVGPAVVNMYAKRGDLQQAITTFKKMSSRNVVVWNSLMAGYVQAELGNEALELYHGMNMEGLQPDIYTFASVLAACSCEKDLAEGKQVHARIQFCGLDRVVPLQNGLVNMYAKCGSLTMAMDMFEKMVSKNSVSWNCMVTGFCQHGRGHEALQLFKEMVLEGAEPQEHTFTSILHLCSHDGRLQDGCEYFCLMVGEFGVAPVDEHYRCMADLLGRTGHVAAAGCVVELMFPDCIIAWTSLLSACRTHRNVEMATRAAEELVRLKPSDSAPIVQLRNLYLEAGRLDEFERIKDVIMHRT